MNQYESLIVIDKKTKEEEVGSIIVDIIGLIDKNGNTRFVQSLGMIVPKRNVKGHCFVFKFEANLEIVEELEKYYGKNGKIVYDLTISQKKGKEQ